MIQKVKICCISSITEAELAIKYGASAIGLVSEMPSGPGIISENIISKIVDSVPNNIDTFLLTSKQDVSSIIAQHKICNTNTIQIVDALLTGSYKDLKNALPSVKIVQVIHVYDLSSVNEAVKTSKHVDAILLDSGNQKLKIKTLGGTGQTHDWSLSKKIVDSVNIPVYLAGGLGPNNVVDAITKVNPYGIDLCSSVRTNDKLDELKLENLFKEINSIAK